MNDFFAPEDGFYSTVRTCMASLKNQTHSVAAYWKKMRSITAFITVHLRLKTTYILRYGMVVDVKSYGYLPLFDSQFSFNLLVWRCLAIFYGESNNITKSRVFNGCCRLLPPSHVIDSCSVGKRQRCGGGGGGSVAVVFSFRVEVGEYSRRLSTIYTKSESKHD